MGPSSRRTMTGRSKYLWPARWSRRMWQRASCTRFTSDKSSRTSSSNARIACPCTPTKLCWPLRRGALHTCSPSGFLAADVHQEPSLDSQPSFRRHHQARTVILPHGNGCCVSGHSAGHHTIVTKFSHASCGPDSQQQPQLSKVMDRRIMPLQCATCCIIHVPTAVACPWHSWCTILSIPLGSSSPAPYPLTALTAPSAQRLADPRGCHAGFLPYASSRKARLPQPRVCSPSARSTAQFLPSLPPS